MTIERDLLELYRDPTLDTKPELLEHRGGAFYSEAAAQLIASLTDGRGDVQVVDVRNDGTLPGLADADVVEVPARIDRDGAHPIAAGAAVAGQSTGSRVKAYERLAIRAAVSGDRSIARAALAATRWPAIRRGPTSCSRPCSRRTPAGCRASSRMAERAPTRPGARPDAMRPEIDETPAVVAAAPGRGGPEIAAAAPRSGPPDPAWVSLVARGTSDHAAIHLRYLIETELGIPAGMAAPSTVTIYGAELRWRGGS